MLPLASRMPVSMASLLRSDSVNPFRNSSSYKERVTNNIDLLVHASLTFFVSLQTNSSSLQAGSR